MVAAAGAVLAKQKRRATDTWMIWGSGFGSEPIINDYYHMTRGINIYEPSNFRVADLTYLMISSFATLIKQKGKQFGY